MNNEDRFRHLYVIGQTGQGKSSIALTMARQDIEQGKGLCIMDPHGELADDILNYIPKERAEDVIYFNAGDEEFPIGLNLLEPKSDAEKDFLSNEFNAMFIKLYGADIWSPRLQEYGQMAALTLMDDEEEGGAITDLVALFTNEEFRNKKRAKVKNEIVRLWWDKTFDSMGDKEKQEIIPYFSAKFNSFVSNGLMRNIVGQAKGSFDFFDAMNDNKIILVNLAKGVIGEQNMSLLGMIFINKIQMATMRRATIPKKERTDFFFYIDEMQNFVSKSIGEILSEVRKYRLGMVMMHQYIAQLVKDGDSSVKDAVFGNVGSILSYKVGAEDAEHMKTEFAPLVSESDLTGLDAFNSVMRMSIDNQPTPPFSLNVQKYWEYDGTIEFDENRAELIKELSRYKYGRKAELVSGEIINRLKG
ncbi:MAG: type IV secretory system conjugative DNA transfer family protein [Patescibacteria group bacterium]|nr:type IV secretory system conjugative DNA transfer family protein [Patescibacteria group bacterium]